MRISASITQSDLVADCANYDPRRFEALSLEWFIQPVSLVVDGVELFVDDAGELLQMSLVHAGANLYFGLQRAIRHGTSAFDLTLAGQPPMVISVNESRVAVEFDRGIPGLVSSAPLLDALDSTREISHEMRALLLGLCPKLSQGQPWADWFNGDDMAGRTI